MFYSCRKIFSSRKRERRLQAESAPAEGPDDENAGASPAAHCAERQHSAV